MSCKLEPIKGQSLKYSIYFIIKFIFTFGVINFGVKDLFMAIQNHKFDDNIKNYYLKLINFAKKVSIFWIETKHNIICK